MVCRAFGGVIDWGAFAKECVHSSARISSDENRCLREIFAGKSARGYTLVLGDKDCCFYGVISDDTSDMTRHVAEFPYAQRNECHKDLMFLLLPSFLEIVDSTETFECRMSGLE
jgi:hypothetical protein